MRRILSLTALALWLLISTAATEGLSGSTPTLLSEGGSTTSQPFAGLSTTPVVSPQQGAPTSLYQANLQSDVFGAQLFSGNFANQGPTQFNPDYMLAVGDRIQVRLWGGFSFDSIIQVDPQGNLFLPQIGPVKVLGVRNSALQGAVETAVRQVFRTNVYCYASLAAAQPVRVFVGGFVNRPGLYNGTSMDSLLHYLDLAGGIDPLRGTFISIEIKRGESVRATINLYDFLLKGEIPLVQFADGDVIFVPPRLNSIKVTGLVEAPRRFEFSSPQITVEEISHLTKRLSAATHIRVTRNTGTIRNIEYFPLTETNGVSLVNGDEIEFTADKKPGTITVRVEGEHHSPNEYVLPYGTRLGELLKKIEFSNNAEQENLQLFRQSVRDRQKQLLETSLRSLETSMLTARSGTNDEARLRTEEAALVMQWVDRAKKVIPVGQVMIGQSSSRDQLLLENGDVIRIPVRDGLVLVSGEVLFPNAIAYDDNLSVEEYIRRAGGYTQNADVSRIVVAHRDGSFAEGQRGFLRKGPEIRQGDEVLVMPKIDVKSRQIFKDLTQILYQIAVSAKVVLSL